MSEQKEPENEYQNISNVLQKNKIYGKRIRNIIEGLVFSLIDVTIILNINFVSKIQFLLLAATIPTIFYLNVRGFKNRSLTEIIYAEIKFHYRRRKLHLRSIDYVRKQNNQIGFVIEGESVAEKASYITKKIVKAFFKK